jgi:2-polyprenyl-6-methoxyphenol hydroxylase-like FAD-dependent oxidoreductase
MRILISGAGIAGLSLAYWLLRHGFAPTLVERAAALRGGGYIIDFWGLGYEVAARMGLVPALHRVGYAIEELRIVDASGRRVGGFPFRILAPMLEGRYVSVLRGDLARVLFAAIDGRLRVIFGDSITALEEEREAVRVTFARAAAERFDLVIGADGLHSAVRRIAFGPAELFERQLGYDAAAFSVAGYARRDENVYVTYAAPGREVFRCSLREDRTVFFLILAGAGAAPASAREAGAQKAILRTAFGAAGWECQAILAAMERADDFYFDRVSQIYMDAWSRGRIALAGDACAGPSLLAGQGAALAMTAAYVLAGELKTAGGNHTLAFGRYEALLRQFITDKQRAAVGAARAYVPRTRLGIIFRNRVTRLMTLPPVARLAVGSLATDRLSLPDYDA